MAGDWIKIDTVLCDKPEVWQIAERLGLEPDTVVGKLIRLWSWMDQHLVSGSSVAVTSRQIDALVLCTGFSTALTEVKWLVIHKRNGTVSVPNWDRHNGKSAKERALTRDRMKRSRDAASVTPPSPEKRREEKRKEEKKKTPPAPTPAGRRDGGARLGAAAPTPPAATQETAKPTLAALRQTLAKPRPVASLIRPPQPPDPVPDTVRADLANRQAIPLPEETYAQVQATA